MSTSDETTRIRLAFSEAASDLRFAFAELPEIAHADLALYGIGHVVHFGSPQGCVPLFMSAHPSLVAAVGDAGFYVSLLFGGYASYDAQLFRDTLNDWGYFGPKENRPAWYVGIS